MFGGILKNQGLQMLKKGGKFKFGGAIRIRMLECNLKNRNLGAFL